MPFVSYDKTSTRRNNCGHVFCIGGIESSQISLRVVAVQVAVLVELVVLLGAALCWCSRHIATLVMVQRWQSILSTSAGVVEETLVLERMIQDLEGGCRHFHLPEGLVPYALLWLPAGCSGIQLQRVSLPSWSAMMLM
jgi:hypothetical protein